MPFIPDVKWLECTFNNVSGSSGTSGLQLLVGYCAQGIYHPLSSLSVKSASLMQHWALLAISVEQKDLAGPWCTTGLKEELPQSRHEELFVEKLLDFPFKTQKLRKRLLQSLFFFVLQSLMKKKTAKHEGCLHNKNHLLLSKGLVSSFQGRNLSHSILTSTTRRQNCSAGNLKSKLSLELPKQMSHKLQCSEAREGLWQNPTLVDQRNP